jgi:hypothetical protein
MLSIIMLAIGLAIAGAIVKFRGESLDNPFESFYAILVFISIGTGGILFGFVPHVFFSDYVAKGIGWPIGSPFQLEVGMHNGSWGLLGLLSLRYRRGFIQATVIGFSVFLIMAGVNHLCGMVAKANYSPFSIQYIVGDFLPALVFLLLAWKYGKQLR